MVINFDIAGTGNAYLTHLSCDESSVTADASAASQYSFGSDHAAQIFGAGFVAVSFFM